MPFSVSTQVDQLINYAKSSVKPAYEYFEEKFTEDLAFPLSVFKQACKFDPSKTVDMHPSADDIEDLRIFPFLNSDYISHELKSELPKYMYLAAAEDVAPMADNKSWWKRNEEVFPNWSSTCKSVLLV